MPMHSVKKSFIYKRAYFGEVMPTCFKGPVF